MEELRKKYIDFLDKRKADTLQDAETLLKEERKDESNILKAKANIYDIFKAIWDAAEKASTDAESFQAAFLQKAESIPAAWEKSLEIAKQHNDVAKIMIEEAKLSAVKEIKDEFLHRIFQD